MPYWRLYYHLVWATKGRQPLLEPQIESYAYRVMFERGAEQGSHLFAMNGMADHVHVVAAIPPRMAVAEFVKLLKGSSSRLINLECGIRFDWQAGYGAFSVSERNLAQIIQYVERQKEHHRAGTTILRLEQTSNDDDGPRIVRQG